MRLFVFSLFITLSLIACNTPEEQGPLPILGNHEISQNGDTLFHRIPAFSFINQDSQLITEKDLAGKIYIADFFFISCPTICPKVTEQMLRIHDRYRDNDHLVLLAHTIDPKRDTVARLKQYAEGLGVSAPKWHFVTGDKSEIYEIAEDYMSIAREDPTAPGGFDHSGWLILIDEKGRIRAFANGTEEEAVDGLMEDIDWLLAHPADGARG